MLLLAVLALLLRLGGVSEQLAQIQRAGIRSEIDGDYFKNGELVIKSRRLSGPQQNYSRRASGPKPARPNQTLDRLSKSRSALLASRPDCKVHDAAVVIMQAAMPLELVTTHQRSPQAPKSGRIQEVRARAVRLALH